MTKEDVIRMAREAGFPEAILELSPTALERFAELVAKHTLANIDPSSFMSWQEGYEVGKQTEREACAKLCENKNTLLEWPTYAAAIRARGQA